MFVGIDLGTGSIKVILTDENLNVLAAESATLSVHRPAPLFSEQNPHDWWIALNHAMQKLRHQFSSEMKKVSLIGLCGQQHGATVLDASGRVLRNAILWNDGRAFLECDEMQQKVPNLPYKIGSQLMPGFTAPKLLWMKKHEPSLFQKIHRILLPKDYLRYLMTGDFATDLSDASGTGWLDVKKRIWCSDLLSACELTVNHMPCLYEGCEITSRIKKTVASEWGMQESVEIVAGAGDNAGSAMSMGCVSTDTAYLSLGTSATFFVATQAFNPNPTNGIHSFCHAIPDFWHDMAVHLNGAACVSWAANLFNVNLSEIAQFTEKNHHAQKLLFIPYLSGERTPHNNPHASGAFFGLDNATQPSDCMQAVLEGVAFGLREGFDAMIKNRIQLREMTIVGGGAKSQYWGKIIASVLNTPLTYRQCSAVGAAFGAAKLAWLAKTKTNPADLFSMPAIDHVVEPNANWVCEYEEKYKAFQQRYRLNYRQSLIT